MPQLSVPPFLGELVHPLAIDNAHVISAGDGSSRVQLKWKTQTRRNADTPQARTPYIASSPDLSGGGRRRNHDNGTPTRGNKTMQANPPRFQGVLRVPQRREHTQPFSEVH